MSTFVRANCTVTVKRITAFLLDLVAVASSHTVNRQPIRQSCAQVRLTGTPSGTVTITGTVNGLSDTEVLSWAGSAGARSTMKQFTAISGITTSLSGATTISVEAVEPGGSPQVASYILKSGHPAPLRQKGGQSQTQPRPGEVTIDGAEVRFDYEDVWAPRVGDLVINEQTADTYEIKGVARQPMGSFAPSFWRCALELKPGKS